MATPRTSLAGPPGRGGTGQGNGDEKGEDEDQEEELGLDEGSGPSPQPFAGGYRDLDTLSGHEDRSCQDRTNQRQEERNDSAGQLV